MLLIVPFLVLASWISSLAANFEPPPPARSRAPMPTVCVEHYQRAPMVVRRTIFVRYEPTRVQAFLR